GLAAAGHIDGSAGAGRTTASCVAKNVVGANGGLAAVHIDAGTTEGPVIPNIVVGQGRAATVKDAATKAAACEGSIVVNAAVANGGRPGRVIDTGPLIGHAIADHKAIK